MHSAGFSLLELLIVIALAAILASVGLSSWRDIQLRNELSSSTMQLMRFLNLIKLDANLYNRNHTIHLFQSDNTRCLAVTPEIRPIDCQTPFQFYFYEQSIEVAGLTENSTLAFYGRRNMAQTATIRLKNVIGESRITISTRGRIRYCSYHTYLAGFPSC